MQTQLDLFREFDEMEALLEHTEKIQKEVTNVRRGVFARLGSVFKTLISHNDRLSAMEVKLGEYESEIDELKEMVAWMESVA